MTPATERIPGCVHVRDRRTYHPHEDYVDLRSYGLTADDIGRYAVIAWDSTVLGCGDTEEDALATANRTADASITDEGYDDEDALEMIEIIEIVPVLDEDGDATGEYRAIES